MTSPVAAPRACPPADFPFAIVGFDLDGTLLDTSGDLAAAVNHAIARIGRAPIATADVANLIGGGGRVMLARALDQSGGGDDALVAELLPHLLDHYEANIAHHTAPFPGMIAALDTLAARGVTLAVVTNKAEHLARKLMGALNLTSRFATIIGGDTLGRENAKPSPAPIHAMIDRCGGGPAAFVGDSTFDTRAARAAGVPSVAVSFGFLDRPVGNLGADHVIDHYDELVPLLARLG